MTGSPAIELRALCKAFGMLQAVDHLTLSVERGEIFGLLGPNGSGKTTTINLISGLSTPTSGEVQVMGYDVRRHARRIRQMLGAVPQETALYEELSAWDNLDFHADLFGMARQGKKARITQMLELEPGSQPIAGIYVTSHQPPVRHLVERVEREHLLPQLRPTQQLEL